MLQPLAASKTVAWERESEIHVLTSVRRVLENWDQDTEATGGCDQVTLLELVELSLHESDPDLDPISAHIVASTFERYLKNTLLTVAVEDFFLEWPPLSTAEVGRAACHRTRSSTGRCQCFPRRGRHPG